MRGGLSPLEVDIKGEAYVREHTHVEMELAPAIRAEAMEVLATTGRYNTDGCIDISMWQATDSTHTATSVNFAGMAHPKFHGAYFKMGEIWGVATPPQTDGFMDPLEKIHREALIAAGQLALGYIYYDPAWALNRGWTLGSVQKLMDGTVTQVAHNLVMSDPHLALLARKVRKGAGRVTDAQVLLDLEDWDADGWVWDFEKGWTSAGAMVGDLHMSTALKMTTLGAKFLADNGYLPKQADTQVVYSSEWFLRTYGGTLTRDVVGLWDTIAAGYYLDEKDGYLFMPTMDALFAWLGKIANTWQPYNIGAVTPGKIVLAYQILSNLTMLYAKNRFGQFTALDWNAFNIPGPAILVRYPKYAARLAAWTPDKPPVEIPPSTRRRVTVLGALHNVRQSAGVVGVADVGDLTKGATFEVDVVPGTKDGYEWGEIKGGVFVALTGNVEVKEA